MSKNGNVNANEARTLKVIFDELDTAINNFNTEEDVMERVKLNTKIKKLEEEYNSLAKLTVYSKCARAEYPVVELAKAFYWEGIATKNEKSDEVLDDGTLKTTEKYSKNKKMVRIDLKDFLNWAKKSNRKVTAEPVWLPEVGSARRAIIAEIKKNKESATGVAISKKAIKDAVQKAFNALAFIKTEKGNNAIIANREAAELVIDLAATLKITLEEGSTDPKFEEKFLEDKTWYPLLMTMLHLVVKNKNYTVTYCDEDEPNAKPTSNKPSTNASTKGRGKGKDKQSEPKPEAEPAPKAEA